MNDSQRSSSVGGIRDVPDPSDGDSRCLLVFSKPGIPGRVKTRLIGELTPDQAAALHDAFLADLISEMASGRFAMEVWWVLEEQEQPPDLPVSSRRQVGADLGARLFHALSDARERFRWLCVVGTDHPELPVSLVERAFESLSAGRDAVFGPTDDGGYYLAALAAGAVRSELFDAMPWSTSAVLSRTVEACVRLGLEVDLLPTVVDIDTAQDLEGLVQRLRADPERAGQNTIALLR